MARKVHGGRSLLNLPGHHSTAAIVAEIEDTSTWPAGKNRSGGDLTGYECAPITTFRITDCDKYIDIEVGFDSDNGVENSLHKIDTMIDCLRKLRRGIVVEAPRYQKRKDQVDDNKVYNQW